MKYSKIKQIILEEIALLKESAKMLRLNGVEPALIDALKKIDEKQILAWFYILINSHPQTANKEIVIKKETIAQLNQQSLLQFLKQNIDKINHIKEWLSNNKSINIRQLAENKKTIDDLYKKAEIWYKTATETNPSEIDGKPVVKTYKDNGSVLVWVDLQTYSCREESKAMGHCGTDEDATTLFSLRSIQGTNIEPHVTLAWNQKKQAVTQVKGKENKPPIPKYMKYVWDFLDLLKAKNPKFQFIWSHKYDLSLKDVGENLGVVKCSQLYARDIVWKTTLPEPTLYYEGEEQKELTEELLNSIKSDSQRATIINGKYNTNYKYVEEFKNGIAIAEINQYEATVINTKGQDVIKSVELTEELLNDIHDGYQRASLINRKYNTNYVRVWEFKNSIALAQINENKNTFINTKGQDVIDSVEMTHELLNNLDEKIRTSLINRKYNTNYKKVEKFKNGITIAIISNNKYTIINLKGQEVIDSINLTEDFLNSISNPVAVAAIINRKYNTNYKYVLRFNDGVAIAEIRKNEYTFINSKGEDVIKSVELTEKLLNSFSKYSKAKLINRKYNTHYREVNKFKNGTANAVTEDGKKVKINLKGEIVNTLNENTLQKWIRYMKYFESR